MSAASPVTSAVFSARDALHALMTSVAVEDDPSFVIAPSLAMQLKSYRARILVGMIRNIPQCACLCGQHTTREAWLNLGAADKDLEKLSALKGLKP